MIEFLYYLPISELGEAVKHGVDIIKLGKNGVPRDVLLFVLQVQSKIKGRFVRDQFDQSQIEGIIKKLGAAGVRNAQVLGHQLVTDQPVVDGVVFNAIIILNGFDRFKNVSPF